MLARGIGGRSADEALAPGAEDSSRPLCVRRSRSVDAEAAGIEHPRVRSETYRGPDSVVRRRRLGDPSPPWQCPAIRAAPRDVIAIEFLLIPPVVGGRSSHDRGQRPQVVELAALGASRIVGRPDSTHNRNLHAAEFGRPACTRSESRVDGGARWELDSYFTDATG